MYSTELSHVKSHNYTVAVVELPSIYLEEQPWFISYGTEFSHSKPGFDSC